MSDVDLVNLIQNNADEWDILGCTVAGETDDGDTLFISVIRRTVSDDGDLIISERYAKADLQNESVHWLKNGIERRMSRGFADALSVLYSALSNDDLDPQDPFRIDTRQDFVDYNAEVLTQPVSDLGEADDTDADDLEADTDADSRPVVESEIEADGSKVVSADGMVETQENELHGAKREQPTCSECGRAINDTDAAVNIGGALGQNIWVHHQCPQDTEEGGAS